MAKVDPQLVNTIKKFGAFDHQACYSCGTCSAICPLSEGEVAFPRKMIRYSLLGLKEKIASAPEPWLCYYCGECSDNCPRDADPAGMMMAMRRYTTSLYDFTGISSKIYLSKSWKIIGIIGLFFLTIFLMWQFHGPIHLDQVKLETFAGKEHIITIPWINLGFNQVEAADLFILITLSTILFINIFRMYYFIVLKPLKAEGKKIPFSAYIKEFWKTLPVHMAIQPKFKDCDHKKYWFAHLNLVFGYVLMFFLVVVCLRWFQSDTFYSFWHPMRLLGYISTVALVYGVGYMTYGRIKKSLHVWKYSHSTDWMLIILLVLTIITGILSHIFKYAHLPMATYVTYTIHLAIVVPMLVLEVPFSKWAHLAYRPLALYFIRLKEQAQKKK